MSLLDALTFVFTCSREGQPHQSNTNNVTNGHPVPIIFVLLSIINTVLNEFSNFIESGCYQNITCLTKLSEIISKIITYQSFVPSNI